MFVKIVKEIIITSYEITEFCHRQNYHKTSELMSGLTQKLVKFMDLAKDYVSKEFTENSLDIFRELLAAQTAFDYVFLSDLLEFRLIPSLLELQAKLVSEEEIIPVYMEKNCTYIDDSLKKVILENARHIDYKRYVIEYTAVGEHTLKVCAGDVWRYYHTNGNPCREGKIFALEYCEDDILNYTVLGFGLGYHIEAILKQDLRYRVNVIETDLNVLCLAFSYMDFSEILASKRLNITYVEDARDLGRYIKEARGKLLLHYPSIQAMDKDSYRLQLEEYFMNLSSVQNSHKLLRSNFYYNMQLGDASVDEIKADISGKTLVYLGGGPSLGERFGELIRMIDNREDICVISAGTVYRKLVERNLIPDYVIITDPAEAMVSQFKGVEATKSGLLYLSTASCDAVRAFKGRRFVIYQNGYDEACKMANEKECTIFDTGGSVSTTAIDIAIRFNCKKLICLGLDLAFKKEASHAFGIGRSINEYTENLMVPAVDGGMLKTAKNLNIYRKWIERRIKNVADVEFVNMSRGAKIAGMKDE